MQCFLFWAGPAKAEEYGRPVRPVSWATPTMILTPYYMERLPAYEQWLQQHGDPVYCMHYTAERNCRQLHNRLGYWPQPIDVPAEEIPTVFNDKVPF